MRMIVSQFMVWCGNKRCDEFFCTRVSCKGRCEPWDTYRCNATGRVTLWFEAGFPSSPFFPPHTPAFSCRPRPGSAALLGLGCPALLERTSCKKPAAMRAHPRLQRGADVDLEEQQRAFLKGLDGAPSAKPVAFVCLWSTSQRSFHTEQK